MNKLISLATLLGAGMLGNAQTLNLKEALEVATSRHPLVVSAQRGVDAARALRTRLLSQFQPSLSLHAIGSEGNGALGVMTMVEPARMFMLPPEPFAEGSLVFSWQVFSSGRDRAVARVGDLGVRLAEAELRGVRLDVALRVRLAFAEAIYRRDAIKGYKSGLEAAEEMERLSRARYEEGKIPQAFVFAAEAQTAKARRDLRLAEADYESALAELRAAIGENLDGAIEPGDWQDVVLPDTVEEAVNLALSLRPELQIHRYSGQKSEAVEQSARRSRFPEVRLFAAKSASTSRSTAPYNSYNLGVFLSIPLLDGSMRSSEARKAHAESARAEASFDAERLAIESEVRSAWAKWRAAEEVIAYAEAELRASEEAYRIAMLRFDVGKAVHAEVSVVLANRIAAEVRLADAYRYKRIAETKLIRAIGLEP